MSSLTRSSSHVSTRLVTGRRIGRYFGMAAVVLVMAGCGQLWSPTPTAIAPDVHADELTDVGGQPCPQELPIGDDPSGHGFGAGGVPDALPTFLEPQMAWVCQYNTFIVGTTPGGGAVYGWSRSGQPDPVAPDDLPNLHAALADLALPAPSGACNSDLGPRWMVVYSHDGDLTGALIDDFACRNVRLTDNPHGTPAGAAGQSGTVGGVFDGGAAILNALGVGRSN